MKYLLIFLFFCSCTKTDYIICHSVEDFYNTKPIDVKKVFTSGFKEVSCNLYAIDIVYYDGTKETIFMDYDHRIIKKVGN